MGVIRCSLANIGLELSFFKTSISSLPTWLRNKAIFTTYVHRGQYNVCIPWAIKPCCCWRHQLGNSTWYTVLMAPLAIYSPTRRSSQCNSRTDDDGWETAGRGGTLDVDWRNNGRLFFFVCSSPSWILLDVFIKCASGPGGRLNPAVVIPTTKKKTSPNANVTRNNVVPALRLRLVAVVVVVDLLVL